MYAMGQLLYPGFFGSYQNYLDNYAEVETKYFRTKYHTLKENIIILGPKSMDAVEALKHKISNFYLRRSYDEVEVEMPNEIVKTIPVILKDCQKKEYLDLVTQFHNKKIKGASLLYGLLRICDGKREDWAKVDKPEKVSAKGEALKDLISSFNGDQFIVYSGYLDPLLAGAKIAKSLGLKVGFYTGVNTENREEASDSFIDGKIDGLFITKAGARGKNWGNARHIIELNSPYNPSLRHQLRSRIKRADSKHRVVFVYTLVALDTVESNVLKLLERKDALAKYINNDDEIEGLSDTQIELLLSKRESLINAGSLEESFNSLSAELAVD
jgi:SNF2 family DNA or RNA helicase